MQTVLAKLSVRTPTFTAVGYPGMVHKACEQLVQATAPVVFPSHTVPADACADGWEPCLSGDNPEARSKFMKDIAAAQCGSSWGAWAAAMSHAPLDVRNSTDHEFCPNRTALVRDNGCRGTNPTTWGGEALCCGKDCEVPTCQSALWPQRSSTCAPGGEGSATCGTLMVKAGCLRRYDR